MTIEDIQLGTDIVNVVRIRKALDRFGVKFAERLLTADELAYCMQKAEQNQELLMRRIAGRIAVKEAVSKALGVGVTGLGYSEGVPWKSIAIESAPRTAPSVSLSGRAQERAESLRIRDWRISLSHDGDSAVATALAII